MEILPVFLFGAPGAVAAALLCILGVIARRPGLVLAGGILALPSAYYLGGQPGLWPFGFALAAFPVLAATALWRDQAVVAGVLLVPNGTAAAYLTAITLRNLLS